MQLLKKTILASVIAALLPVASFAQTEEVQPADDTNVDVASYWTNNNEEALETAFEDYSLSWGSYINSLGHESEESTRFSDLFHAFTADFTTKYGVQPQQASIDLLKSYYAQRKNSYGGELLLPTIAVWKNRPMLSIVPLPDQLDSYWGQPDQAADTYDFMASIDHEDTLYYMGSHMGAFFGHPTKRKTLESFWKKWMKRADSSAAKQDVDSLKRIMLAEILSHDPEYAVQELASKKVDLWPALYTKPVTQEESSRVREIVSSYCLNDSGTVTESCMNFAKYADHFEYTNDIVQEIRNQLAKNNQATTGAANYDEIYNSSTTYVVVDPDLLWPYDPWYGWYYQGGVYIYWNIHRPFIYPWYWRYWNPWRYRHYPPVVIGRPGHHRPPTIHHGHRPPAGHGHGGHNPGLRPGGTHRPGGHHYNGGFGGGRPNPGGNNGNGRRPGGNGHNPGHNPGGNHDNGGHGGNGHNPGHNPGGNHDNGRPGGNGHNPGGNGHNPGHNPGGNGHNPGHNPGGNHDNGGHGNPGAHPGNNNGGHGNPGTTVRPPVIRDNYSYESR